MQQLEKKYFVAPESGLDADSADFAVPPNRWVNMENCRTLTTDNGVTKTVESIGGTLLKSTPQPSINFFPLGSAEEQVRKRFCTFMFNTTGNDHKIICYDYAADTIYTVLLSNQTTDGLGFDKYYPIHSAFIINGLLYWTDNLNQLRRINIDAGINLNHPNTYPDVEPYTTGLDENIITVIRKPPNYCLNATKVVQSSPALPYNFITFFAGKFAAFYTNRDGEVTVLSGYSQLINYNTKSDTYNSVDVALSIGDVIPQDVIKVQFAVQFGDDPDFFVIKIWDSANATDAAEMAAHNAGSQALTYRFYNDQTGIPLGTEFSTKPFDSVPIRSETIELAKNRLHTGNNLEGYDSPLVTSLTAQFATASSGTSLQGSVFRLVFNGGGATKYVVYIPSITDGNPPGYYRVTAGDTVPPPDPVAQVNLTFISATETAVFQYYVPGWPATPIDSFTFQNYITVTGVSNPLINQTAYKSGAAYRAAVWFFDRWMRKCGVVINGITYVTPDREYTAADYTVSLNWILSNGNAVNEIPDWAYFYTVGRTKCLSTSFFLQARSRNASNSLTYVNRDPTTNDYTFTTSAYSSLLVGIGVNINNLQNFGMGYVLAEGDVIKIYLDGSSDVHVLRIIDQSGQWLVCELKDIGALTSTTDALFEIYTPYTPSINEAYYEIGQIYAINNPGTDIRTYSVLAGSIRGDITLLSRGTSPSDYITENMSPNDTYYMNWYTDAGRPNFIDSIGQQLKETNDSWSNVLIPGTKTNGLSSFDALDERNLPEECGAIQKFQVTSKVQDEQGIVMLAICKNETASLYIGEVQTYQANASSDLIISEQVIGTINVLKGSYGTTNPESVTEYRGNVYWVDVSNGRVIQYSVNGLDAISDYDMTRYWKLFGAQFLSMTKPQIEALGSRPFIFSVVDSSHNELLFSVPKLLSAPPKGYLPDYPSIAYPFDIYDGQDKIIVYKLNFGDGTPHWQGSYRFYSQGFVSLQNKMYSYNNGHLYLHNQTTNYNQFYGVQEKSRIMFVSNQEPNVPKSYNSISIEGNLQPTFTYLYATVPHQQASDLVDTDYNNLEGMQYATLYRNKLVPTAAGYTTDGLLTGDKMRTHALSVMLEFSVSGSSPLELRFVNMKYTVSKGHKTT